MDNLKLLTSNPFHTKIFQLVDLKANLGLQMVVERHCAHLPYPHDPTFLVPPSNCSEYEHNLTT